MFPCSLKKRLQATRKEADAWKEDACAAEAATPRDLSADPLPTSRAASSSRCHLVPPTMDTDSPTGASSESDTASQYKAHVEAMQRNCVEKITQLMEHYVPEKIAELDRLRLAFGGQVWR